MTTTFTAHPDPALREPFEVGHVQWLRRPGDGDREGLMAGYWHVTPEEFPPGSVHEFPMDETIYVVEGAMRIEVDGGETLELATGDTNGSGSFPEPVLTKYTDMQELLLLDPIHEVDERGWPNRDAPGT